MCGGGEGSEGQCVFNGRIWCGLKIALRYRSDCTMCRVKVWELRKEICLELDGVVFCRGEKWSGYSSGLYWFTVEAAEMFGKCEWREEGGTHCWCSGRADS